jgi:hypothetical protein
MTKWRTSGPTLEPVAEAGSALEDVLDVASLFWL